MIQIRTLLTIALAVFVLSGTMGIAAATPGEGPPDDLPDQVPDFVTDLLGAISDFVTGAIGALGDVVSDITPGLVALQL